MKPLEIEAETRSGGPARSLRATGAGAEEATRLQSADSVCSTLQDLLILWFVVGPAVALVQVLAWQSVIYIFWQQFEFFSLIFVIGVPAYLSFVIHLALFDLARFAELDRNMRSVAMSLSSYILLFFLYQAFAGLSLLPRHPFQVYMKGLVVMAIPFYVGLACFSLFGMVWRSGRLPCMPKQRAGTWPNKTTGTALRDHLRHHAVFLPLLLLLLFSPMRFTGLHRVNTRMAENVESIKAANKTSPDEVYMQSIGDFEFVAGQDGTLYNKFRWLRVPDDNPECAKYLKQRVGHPLGDKSLYCFVGLATGGPSEKMYNAGMRFPREMIATDGRTKGGAFFIVLSEVGSSAEGEANFQHILRFFPKMYNAEIYNWTEDYTEEFTTRDRFDGKSQQLEFSETSFIDVFYFLYLEDFPYTILDLVHGALNSCYCYGMIGFDAHGNLVIRRHNRWTWDVSPSWTARKVARRLPDILREDRRNMIK